ncbi:MAG: ATP-binding cassette domain-containing protein [Firmicutes bacterium]|nr:ATP-binding cassette domain-containing protein [Bacillota bacterium]
MALVIEVEGLGKVFQTKEKGEGLRGSLSAILRPTYRSTQAVRGISFHVERGEMLAFIGPNGAGKSTTIKMLTGILHPTAGMARVLGLIPWRDRYGLSFHIGSVFGQKSQLWYHLPPTDTFTLLARIYELDHHEFIRRRDMLIDAFAISDLMEIPVRKLSLGQRMRCEIAAAMLHGPQILFLDEPTIGLDVVARQTIRDLIKWMNEDENTTVFLTSHDTGDIESLCKRVMVINHGTIILDDAVSTLRRDYIKQKVIDLKFGIVVESFRCPGAEILKQKGSGMKLLVNTDQVEIRQVLEYIVQHYPVVDVNISNPPLEQVISQIYRESAAETVGVVI